MRSSPSLRLVAMTACFAIFSPKEKRSINHGVPTRLRSRRVGYNGGPVSRILSRAVICLGPARCRGHPAAYPRGRDRVPSAGRRPSAWPCSGWSLPCPECYHPGGALLPHLFTLTCAGRRCVFCGTGQGLPLPAVSRHPALWSSDFPLPGLSGSDHLAHRTKVF